MKRTIHVRDTFVRKAKKENFYHGILLGLLEYRENWIIKSNAEAGNGYYDIRIQDVNNDLETKSNSIVGFVQIIQQL